MSESVDDNSEFGNLPAEVDGLVRRLIAERDEAQSHAREMERRFRAIFEQPHHYILLVEPDGTLIDANEVALHLGGVTAADVAGRTLWDEVWWKLNDETRRAVKEVVERVAAGESISYESDIQELNGLVLHYETTMKPIFNSKGEVTTVVLEGRDVSAMTQNLEDLRQTRNRLEEAQRIAQIGHWEYDLIDDRAVWSEILYEILGLAPHVEASDEELLKRIHPDDVDAVRRALDLSISRGRPYEVQFQIVRPDGATRAVFAAGNPVLNEKGEVTLISGIIQDVTGHHELERSLAEVVKRLSALNTMGQAVASSLDTGSIYRYVLSSTRELLGADAVILFMHEGDELYIAAIDEQRDSKNLGLRIAENAGIAGEVWGSGQAIWLSGHQARARRLPQLHDVVGYEPATIVAVPVRWRDELMGILEVADVNEDAFTLDDVRTLEAVATWTAIAIGNANQRRILDRRLQESEAIAAVSRELSETLEPKAILELIVHAAHNIVPRSDWAVIHLLRGRPEQLMPVAVAGTDVDLSHYILEAGEGIAGHAHIEGRAINAGDIQNDPRASRFARGLGLRSLLVVPIQYHGRGLGTISLHSIAPNAFSDVDARLLAILAAQAGLAIENTHLFDSQRRARMAAEMQRERLQVLTDRLVSSQEDERMRISRELHDEAGQALTSLKISLDLARARLPGEQAALRRTLSDLGALAGETMDMLRTLAHDLRPPGLDAFGLNVALDGLCHDFARRTGLAVVYEGVEMPELRTAVALSIYRLVQEALTNIAKHAGARSVAVNLFSSGDSLHLSVIDDGQGFTFDANGQRLNGIGLVSMQERTDLLGGTLEIDTAPGRGTRLTAHIPIDVNPLPTY